jgi:twinkle protein
MTRIRYLVTGCDCRWIILDHLSIVVSGNAVDVDERRTLDMAMTQLATMVKELGFGLLLVHHLKRPDGKGHEIGGEVSLSQLRGSHGISQLSDTVFGIERNQQGDNPNYSKVKILKNRFSGETGVGTHLLFDSETGRLIEVPDPALGFSPVYAEAPADGEPPTF